MALIRLGFDLDESHPDFQPLRQRLLAFYRDNLSRKTRPFPGMDELLDQLETLRLQLGRGHQQTRLADRSPA